MVLFGPSKMIQLPMMPLSIIPEEQYLASASYTENQKRYVQPNVTYAHPVLSLLFHAYLTLIWHLYYNNIEYRYYIYYLTTCQYSFNTVSDCNSPGQKYLQKIPFLSFALKQAQKLIVFIFHFSTEYISQGKSHDKKNCMTYKSGKISHCKTVETLKTISVPRNNPLTLFTNYQKQQLLLCTATSDLQYVM